MSPLVIGVDPGMRDGAAVQLDGDRVIQWCAWWLRGSGERQHMVTLAARESEARPCVSPQDAVRGVFSTRSRLYMEGQRVYPGSANAQSVVQLAYSAGQTSEALAYACPGPPRRVMAAEWRRVVLGIGGRVGARACEARALQVAPQLLDWSETPWPEGDEMTKAGKGALAEAACIARWGALRERMEGRHV